MMCVTNAKGRTVTEPLPPIFLPVRSKLEAVVRITQLTNSCPETLGQRSKDHKSVFVDLARRLWRNPDAKAHSKQSLGGRWHAGCESNGQTVTLDGLDLLLKL